MSYGLKITGNDDGGNFTVADTDLGMVNLVVTDVGRASSFNLVGGIQPGDYIYVRYPSAPGGGGYTPIQMGEGLSAVQIDRPLIYNIDAVLVAGSPTLDMTINFKGSAWKWLNSPNSYQSDTLYTYNDFVVDMDYFVVRKASTINALGLDTSEDYGFQLLNVDSVSGASEIALDSRSFTSDKTFYIEGYLPPDNNFGEINGNSTTLSYTDGCYVNLEWSARSAVPFFPSFGAAPLLGLSITDTMAYSIDGDTTIVGGGGEPELRIWSSYNAIFAAKLGAGISSSTPPNESGGGTVTPPPTEPNEITGTIDYVSGDTVTEGNTISFNAVTSVSSNYHTRVFRLSGSAGDAGKDFNTVTSPFTGTSHTVTLSTYDTSSGQQTFNNIYSQGYVRTYSRDRVSAYTREVAASYSRTFVGNFIGNYSGTTSYQTDFSSNYNQTVDYTRTISRTESFIGNYSRSRLAVSTRTSIYSRNISYTGNFLGNYAGAYSRTRTKTSSYTRDFSRTDSYTGNYEASRVLYEGGDEVTFPLFFVSYYSRVRPSSFAGTYTRNRADSNSYTGYYSRTSTRTVPASYLGTYSRNRVSTYARSRATSGSQVLTFNGTYTRYFSGAYSRTGYYSGAYTAFYTGNFGQTADYSRFRQVSFTGNYSRNVTSTNTFSRSFTNTTPYSSAYSRTTTGTITDPASTRNVNYSRSFVGDYANTGTFMGNFVGNYLSYFTRNVGYARTTVGYQYIPTPRTYWYEYPHSEQIDEPGGAPAILLRHIVVYVGNVIVATGISSSLNPTTYLLSGGVYYHKGSLRYSSGGDQTYFSIGQSLDGGPPSAGTSYYTRTGYYASSYAGAYARTFAGTGTFSRSRLMEYSRVVPYTLVRTSTYTGYYSRSYTSGAVRTASYTAYYAGTASYTRNRAATYVGNYTGAAVSYIYDPESGQSRVVSPFSSRQRIAYYSGTYTRGLSYSRNRPMSYAGAYTRTSAYSASYVGNYSRTLSDSYSGTYANTYIGNYTGAYSRTITQGTTFTGNYAGTGTQNFTGTYSRWTTNSFTRTRLHTITRTSSYSRGLSFIGEYTGMYTRDSVITRPSTLDYNGIAIFTENFAGEYTRNSGSGFTKLSTYSRTNSFLGNYIGNFSRTETGTPESTRNRTSSYTRTGGASYERNIVDSYVGTYIGNYTGASTRTPSNTSEIGWQGERFVIELRRGSDATSMGAARGTIPSLDSKEFTLIDNDTGLFVAMSPQVLHHTATQHELVFDFFTEGTSVVPARIYRGSSILVNSFNLVSNQRNSVIVNEVPPEGSNYIYTLKVFDGSSWILASYYQVTKVTDTDYTPPTDGGGPPTPTYTAPTPAYYTGGTPSPPSNEN